jgi:hypothetical protein
MNAKNEPRLSLRLVYLFTRRKPRLLQLQKSAVGSVARGTKRNVIEDRFFCFSGLFSQQLQSVLRRTALTLWIWEIFGKMLPPQLQKLLFRKRLLLVLPWLAPRIRQGESPPQRADRPTRSSDRAWANARLYRVSAAWVSMPNSVAISFQEKPSSRR